MSTLPNIQPWTITPEDEATFRATDATSEWLFHRSADVLRPYMGQWVAAKDCRIIAAAETMDALLKKLGDIDLSSVILHSVRRLDGPSTDEICQALETGSPIRRLGSRGQVHLGEEKRTQLMKIN